MSQTNAFVSKQPRGWATGLSNLLRLELDNWFGSRLWITMILLWGGIINGMLFLSQNPAEGFLVSATLYTIFGGLFPPIAVAIILQASLVEEKKMGTAAWILSKPVARPAFVLAKWIANTLGVLITIVLVPGVIAYLEFGLLSGVWVPPVQMAMGIGVIFLVQLFYVNMTLMLGAFYDNGGPVIALPITFHFMQQLFANYLPGIIDLLPWSLIVPVSGSDYSVSLGLILGEPVNVLPILTVTGLAAVFLLLAIWRFAHTEL